MIIVAGSLATSACRRSESHPVTVLPGEPVPGLRSEERGRFLLGRALFERVATEEEGLGPLSNADRCSDCHDQPAVGGGGTAILVRKATRFEHGRCDLLEGSGGENIQARATGLLLAHSLGPEEVPPEANGSVQVTAPPLFGLGLVEAIPDSVLVRLEDPDDRDGDGISGRLPRLPDGRIARFGRKGDAADLAGFVDSALRFELGLTTPENPVEETRNGVPIPGAADPASDPEIDARAFALLTDYVRLLGAPAPERLPPGPGPGADSVSRGARLFEEIGCGACHVPELRTGPTESEGLRFQTVRLYSDLLVHDLGRAEGDVCGWSVAPGEYRTALLWGLRHRGRYMHDGRARDLIGAISLHGGEARAVREAFMELSPESRAALLRFLSSL